MEERSPRLPVTEKTAGSNPVRRASSARYANRKSGEAQTFVILRVRLPPLPLETRVGWASACPSGCNPPVSDSAGSTPARRTEARKSARSSIGSGHQPLTLEGRVQFPHGSFGTTDQVVESADTRRSERRAHTGLGVRLSPWSLQARLAPNWLS